MPEPKRELDEIFRQMDRMRRAWEHVSPSRKLNKSQFGTLFALARLSGEREKCPGCKTAGQGENAEKAGPAVRDGNMAEAKPAAQDGAAIKTDSAAQDGSPEKAGQKASGETAAKAMPTAPAAEPIPPAAEPALPVTEPAAPDARPITLSELAGAMHQSLPALSQRVTALEEKGFVERVANPADRRVTGLRLTETGRSEMDAAFRRFGGILSQAAGRVGRQNMRLLLQLLGELADALNEAAEAADEEPSSL